MAHIENKKTRMVKRLLAEVDKKIVPKVHDNAEAVEQVVSELSRQFSNLSPRHLLHGANVMHGGSAYEGLAVSEKTDFDIIICLNKPYIIENFVVGRDPSMYFTLKWRKLQGLYDKAGYLHAEELQKQLFDALTQSVKRLDLRNMRGVNKVELGSGLAALDLQITTRSGTIVSVDLAPHFAVRNWSECPDLKPLNQLPSDLRSYIETLQANHSPIFFLSPSAPGRQINKHRLCNISFAMLEKEFLKSNQHIREMVRMVKLVALANDWKKEYALKSFYIKRVAIKYHDSLLHESLWGGFKAILTYLQKELEANTIDGYFVANQVTYKRRPEKVANFRDALVETKSWQHKEVENMVRRYWKNK